MIFDQRDDIGRYNELIEKLGIRDAINLLPQRVFLPAKAAEAAAQRERQRSQLVAQGRKKMETEAAVRASFSGKREVCLFVECVRAKGLDLCMGLDSHAPWT